MKSNVLVSIVMPVFNGERYVAKSIQSLLSQTHEYFELIIINDGSKDNTELIIKLFKDKRIKYFYQENVGLARTLNRGIGYAAGRYIVRQDQDDFSEPNRIELQLKFLESHNDISMVGSAATIWVGDKKTKRLLKHPMSDAEIRTELLFYNRFVHSSVMVRTKVIKALGGYPNSPERQPPEDYELWSRLARNYKVSNLSETLLNYVEVDTSISRSSNSPFLKNNIKLSIENLIWATEVGELTKIIEGLANLMHRNYSYVPKEFKLSDFETCLFVAVERLKIKCDLNPDHVAKSYRKLLRILRIIYIDYIFGGIFSYLWKLKFLNSIIKWFVK